MYSMANLLARAEAGEQVEDAETDRDVEHRDRLVGDEHTWSRSQRSCDGDALALAAGKLVWVLVKELPGWDQLDPGEQPVKLVLDRAFAAPTVVLERPRKLVPDLVQGVERGERILEDHLHGTRPRPPRALAHFFAVEEDLTACGAIEPGDQSGDGRLPAARLAHKRDDLAGVERERDAVHCVHHGPRAKPRRAGTAATGHREVLHEISQFEGRGLARYDRAASPGAVHQPSRTSEALLSNSRSSPVGASEASTAWSCRRAWQRTVCRPRIVATGAISEQTGAISGHRGW